MALADRQLARDPGLSERPAGGVTGPDSTLAQGGAAAAPGAAWLAAAHCPTVTRTARARLARRPWPARLGQPCFSQGLSKCRKFRSLSELCRI